jgi:SlyX protein
MASEERLHDLEIRLTFVDDAVSALSAADAGLAQRLATVERTLADVRSELAALRAALGHDARDEQPPPHY